MKILVVIPPYVLGGNSVAVTPHKAMLPVGPLIVAGQLRDRGHEVEVLDLVYEEEWWRTFLQSSPDILLLSCHTIRNIPCCSAVLNHLCAMWGHKPHVVLGGNACLHLGMKQFRKLGLEVDAVVRGFGHSQNVLEAVENKQRGDIRSQDVTGHIPIAALELLPAPVHDRYREFSEGKYPIYAFGLGCHWYKECGETYCNADMDSPWLERPFGSVAEELRLAKQYGYDKVWCVDNLLFTDLEVTLQFDRLCAELEMEWSGMTRVELVCKLPQGFLQRLTRLTEVAMGVEAASANLLQEISRSTTRAKTLEAFRRVNAAGIRSNAFVILDLVGATEEDFIPNLYELLVQIRCATVSWSFLVLLDSLLQRRINPKDWGFYRYPAGHSRVPATRVVQQAMVLSGKWWDDWTPNLDELFFETETKFGVNFLEGRIVQEKSARDAAGDIWHVWKKGRRIPCTSMCRMMAGRRANSPASR